MIFAGLISALLLSIALSVSFLHTFLVVIGIRFAVLSITYNADDPAYQRFLKQRGYKVTE